MKTHLIFLFIYLLAQTTDSVSQGVWTQKADFAGTARCYAVGFSIGNKGYIGTGGDINASKKDFWEWDQASNTWTQKADFGGTARWLAAGFSVGNKGYVTTGYDGTGSGTADLWEWDKTSNTWAQKTALPGLPRNQATGFSIGTYGYVATGTGASAFNDLWQWNQSTNSWLMRANYSHPTFGAMSFAIGTKGYVGCGDNNSDFWEWDQTSNTWTQKANFGGGIRQLGIGFSIGSKGYIGMGQDNGSNKFYDFWEWDQAANTWTQQSNLGTNVRIGGVAFSIGNKGYVGTGWNLGVRYKDFWEFTPNGNGISEEELQHAISVYPNPTTGRFAVQSSKVKVKTIELTDATGNLIQPLNMEYGNTEIRSDVSSGIYFLQLHTDKGTVSKKIVVKR